MMLSFTSSSREPSRGAWGAVAGAGAAVGLAPPTAARMSSRVTRPPKPEPRRVVGARLCSAASFLTAGERRVPPLPPPATATSAAGAAATAAGELTAAAFGSGLTGAGAAAEGAPATSIWAITAPTRTVSPWAAVILTSLPSKGEGISALTLSVTTSTIGSSRLTKSPSFFSQWSTVPSVTDSMAASLPAGRGRDH